MARQFYTKIISKASSIVADLDQPDYSDTVLHSKNLIDLLTFHALKLLGAPIRLRFERGVTDEEKLEYLLDKNLISEKVYDNCMNAKGLRNPTEHVFTYPNEFFAKGAAIAAFELFYALQHHFNLPQINKVDAKAVELGVQPLSLMHIMANRYIGLNEIENTMTELHTLISKHAGPYTCILDFPEGTTHPNGNPTNGITLDIKGSYDPALRSKLLELEYISEVSWEGLEIIESLPHTEEHNRSKYPHMFK